MVSKKTLAEYGFAGIEEYFDYILESKENGQHQQARELYASLSKDDGMQSQGQKTAFWDYVETTYYYEARDCYNNDYNGELTELQLLKQYFLNR